MGVYAVLGRRPDVGDSKGVDLSPSTGAPILAGRLITVEPDRCVRSAGTVQGLGKGYLLPA